MNGNQDIKQDFQGQYFRKLDFISILPLIPNSLQLFSFRHNLRKLDQSQVSIFFLIFLQLNNINILLNTLQEIIEKISCREIVCYIGTQNLFSFDSRYDNQSQRPKVTHNILYKMRIKSLRTVLFNDFPQFGPLWVIVFFKAVIALWLAILKDCVHANIWVIPYSRHILEQERVTHARAWQLTLLATYCHASLLGCSAAAYNSMSSKRTWNGSSSSHPNGQLLLVKVNWPPRRHFPFLGWLVFLDRLHYN